mgnify:CR=1 FL=1
MPFNPVDESFDLTYDEGVFLVKLARNAITRYLRDSIIIKPPMDTPEKLKRKSGVFVTLNIIEKSGRKNLRGCIGYPEPVLPLVNATIDSAINAAVEDPRFPPLTIDELDKVVIEDHEVKGVVVRNERIESDKVIVAIPCQQIFTILDENRFPAEFVEKAKNIIPIDTIYEPRLGKKVSKE